MRSCPEHRAIRHPTSAFCTLAALLVTARAAAQVVLVESGEASATSSTATGLSADGIYASGAMVVTGSVRPFAFRYNRITSERLDIERGVPRFKAEGRGISGNGNVVVGYYGDAGSTNRGFRWSPSLGTQLLPLLPQRTDAVAMAANFDGSVVVGEASRSVGQDSVVFRWTALGGTQAIPFLPNHDTSYAGGVSADGNVVTGTSVGSSVSAWRWTPQNGTVSLPGSSQGWGPNSEAYDVSADGNITVGIVAATSPSDYLAAKWSALGVLQILPPIAGTRGMGAHAVSGDGSVVGGFAYSGGVNAGRDALIWTQETSSLFLADYLALFDVTLPAGYRYTEVKDISADGLTFCGIATDSLNRTHGWIAHVPTPSALSSLALAGAFASHRRRRRESCKITDV